MKHLILNADDFAFNAAVSRGIVTLAQQGRLTATSAMTLSPRWAADAPALAELRGHIDVGLHLDWTSAFAVKAGHGRGLKRAMLSAVMGGFNKTAAQVVIERQLDAFEQVWQAPPSHIDGHQHVHQFKGIRDALVEVMVQRYSGLPADQKPYLRISQDPTGQADFKSKVIAGLGANTTKNIATKAYITTAKGLFGVYNFKNNGENGGLSYAERMQAWLAQAPAVCIIMCHPANGKPDGGDAEDDIAPARQWEFDYLANSAFADDLANAQVSLSTLFSMKSPIPAEQVSLPTSHGKSDQQS
jgi:chitin disaccharide deacetylase